MWRWPQRKRVESSWHMLEEQAARYKEAEQVEITKPAPSTSDFLALAVHVNAGHHGANFRGLDQASGSR